MALPQLFQFILKSPGASPLRDELRKPEMEEKLMRHTFNIDQMNPYKDDMHFQGIAIVRTMCKFYPQFLCERPRILEALVSLWRSNDRKTRLSSEENLELAHLMESKMLVKCLLSYVRQDTIDTAPNSKASVILFSMLSIFNVRTVVDYSFLKQFYVNEVANRYSLGQRKGIVNAMLLYCKDTNTSQELKVQALQLIIIPMLTSAFSQPEPQTQLLDEDVITLIVKSLLDPGDDVVSTYEEPFHIELLQLATLLIKHLKKELINHRKELIKFAWDRLKKDESTSKQWAYVNVCRFIEAYDAPHKIILQVYVALLRAYQPEQRTLLKQALDILTPALPKRLPPAEHKYPIWIRYTKTAPPPPPRRPAPCGKSSTRACVPGEGFDPTRTPRSSHSQSQGSGRGASLALSRISALPPSRRRLL